MRYRVEIRRNNLREEPYVVQERWYITPKQNNAENLYGISVGHTLEEATKYADLNQLCLSPQCGFSSTEEGNTLSEQQQWDKLRFVVEVAEEVWGKSA